MQRERAVHVVTVVLERLAAAEYPLTLVDELHVFGSFARGALEPHDVDLDVEFTADADYSATQIGYLTQGRHPDTDLRAALAGRSRGLQVQFQQLANLHQAGITTTLLWRRGENLAVALRRLAEVKADPQAARAPRDEMHPAFEGIDRWVPRPVRSLLTVWVEAGAVALRQLELPDAPVRDAIAAQAVDERWVAHSPLRRAASNALAHLEGRGVSLRSVRLHGREIAGQPTEYYIGIGWRHVNAIHPCLTRRRGIEWLEVPHPARREPLQGIAITVVDREVLAKQRSSV